VEKIRPGAFPQHHGFAFSVGDGAVRCQRGQDEKGRKHKAKNTTFHNLHLTTSFDVVVKVASRQLSFKYPFHHFIARKKTGMGLAQPGSFGSSTF